MNDINEQSAERTNERPPNRRQQWHQQQQQQRNSQDEMKDVRCATHAYIAHTQRYKREFILLQTRLDNA